MPSDTLSLLGASILLAVWRLNSVGGSPVAEETLKSELPDPSENFPQELNTLQELGFITRSTTNGKAGIALTPLGLAILRQTEEDKLQELG